jgi:hypothetical protein
MKNAKIKYWINELPLINMPKCWTVEEQLLTQCDGIFTNTRLALEMFLHKDAGYYGMLGVEYYPELCSDKIKIAFNYTTKNALKYDDTLLQCSGEVFLGLMKEYLPYTRKSVRDYLYNSNKMPSGVLNFNIAAHNEVGSSPKLFGVISEMLIELIVKTNDRSFNEKMDDLVKNVFCSSRLFVQ